MLSPFGILLFDIPLADDDVDESLEALSSTGNSADEATNSRAHEIHMCIDIVTLRMKLELNSPLRAPKSLPIEGHSIPKYLSKVLKSPRHAH